MPSITDPTDPQDPPTPTTVLQIKSPANVYAHIFRDIEIDADAEEIVFEASIRVGTAGGSSWTTQVGFFLANDTLFTAGHQNIGNLQIRSLTRKGPNDEDLPSTIDSPSNKWVHYRLVATQDARKAYLRVEEEEDWTLFGYNEGPLPALPTELWIGKGLGSVHHGDSSHATTGSIGYTYVADVVLTVDGEEVYRDHFETLDGWNSHFDPGQEANIAFTSVDREDIM